MKVLYDTQDSQHIDIFLRQHEQRPDLLYLVRSPSVISNLLQPSHDQQFHTPPYLVYWKYLQSFFYPAFLKNQNLLEDKVAIGRRYPITSMPKLMPQRLLAVETQNGELAKQVEIHILQYNYFHFQKPKAEEVESVVHIII